MPPDVNVTVKDGTQDTVRPFQRLLTAHSGDHLGVGFAGGDNFVDSGGDLFQPQGIDVHQGDFTVGKGGKGQKILYQPSGKADASCPDKGKFFHDAAHPFGMIVCTGPNWNLPGKPSG